MRSSHKQLLVGELGVKDAVFSLAREDGSLSLPQRFAREDFSHLVHAIETFLEQEQGSSRPVEACLAAASPILDDHIRFTNSPWRFSIAATKQRLGLQRLEVINDFTARALALPHLESRNLRRIGGHGVRQLELASAVIGPETGLGTGAIFGGRKSFAIASEGGHATLTATNARERAVFDQLTQRFGHASAERALSGPGLVNLYQALCTLEGEKGLPLSSREIVQRAAEGLWPRCSEAVDIFCGWLGSFAGDLTLTYGARGGLYLTSSVIPELDRLLLSSRFRERFENKGRMREYLAEIPVFVIVGGVPALLGASAHLGLRPKAPKSTTQKIKLPD